MPGTLTPAYGRDFKNKREILEALERGLDFSLNLMGSATYVNLPQLADGDYQVRYGDNRKITVVKVRDHKLPELEKLRKPKQAKRKPEPTDCCTCGHIREEHTRGRAHFRHLDNGRCPGTRDYYNTTGNIRDAYTVRCYGFKRSKSQNALRIEAQAIAARHNGEAAC